MREDIIDRVLKEAEYMITTRCTVRECAMVFGISKSTLHQDVRQRLKERDRGLYIRISKLMGYNLSVRHLRGGEATRRKYKKSKD